MRRFANIIETVPVPCRVCGTALRPFSLGHHLMFTRLGLPFADNPAADCTTAQMLEAIFVCAHTWEENMEGHLSGEWAPSLEKWIGAVLKTRPDMAKAIDIFREHLVDGYRVAPIWNRQSKGGASFSAPLEQLLKVRLIRAGFTMSEVMNGYLPERWYDYFTACEIEMAEKAQGPDDWKRIFYTLQDALDDEATDLPAPEPEQPPTPAQ